MSNKHKCLIIAAGLGSRLSNMGESKPLTPLLDIPLIERVILSASEAGVEGFYVVTGYKGETVRDFLDDLSVRRKIKINHIINDEWKKKNGVSVLKAKNVIDGTFFLLMSDHIFDPKIIQNLSKLDPGTDSLYLAVDTRLDNPMIDIDDVTKVKVENGKIIAIGKTIADYNAFDSGIFLCSQGLFDALEESMESEDTSLSDGVLALASKEKASVFDIGDSFWIDVDDEAAFKKAEEHILKNNLK